MQEIMVFLFRMADLRALPMTSTPPEGVGPGDASPFVTFTCARDVHYAKALLGSIRHFYPDRRIIVVAEADLPKHDMRQIEQFPGVEVMPVMSLIRRHKLHLSGLLNKLNVLFLPGVKHAIVCDADSILVDAVDRFDRSKVFTALSGFSIDLEDVAQRDSFDEWAISLDHARRFDEGFPRKTCRWVQGSHFAVNTERFPYDLLFACLPHLCFAHADKAPLRAGDQGFWNTLVNWSGLAPDACEVFHVTVDALPVHQASFKAKWNTIEWMEERAAKEVSFIHYVGAGRRYRRRDHVCPGPLQWGTALYYALLGRRAYVRDEVRRMIRPVVRRLGRSLEKTV